MLSSEVENLLHTVKDIMQMQELLSYNIKHLMETQSRINLRIDGLEQRLNRMVKQENQ